jgi:hypothetical protein
LDRVELPQSLEQRADYDVVGVVTSVAFVGSVFGNLVFSAFLLTLQLAEDRRLRDLKERTTKARRLRYLLSDEEVTLKALKPLNTLLPQLHPHTENEGLILVRGPFTSSCRTTGNTANPPCAS